MKPRGPTADDVILMKNDNAPRIFAEVATKLSRWSSRYPWLRQIVPLAIVVVPLNFLFWGLTTNWQDLQSYDWQFNSISGGLAVCCLTLAFGLIPLASQQALLGLGYSIGYRAVYAGHFTAQLAKYLPGGLVILPGRAIVLGRYGVNVISSSVGTIVELLMLLVSGVVVFLPALSFVCRYRVIISALDLGPVADSGNPDRSTSGHLQPCATLVAGPCRMQGCDN